MKAGKKTKLQVKNYALRKLFGILFAFIMLTPALLFSQINVTAKLDTNSILIGQQTKLHLTVNYRTDKGEVNIQFPQISDTIMKQVEVVSKTKPQKIIDSTDLLNFTQTQTLTITSFDSGYYAIPPFKFLVNGDTNETEALLLSVSTIPVDTTKTVKDIKPPIQVPFSWMDYLPYVYWTLGIAVLALLIYFLIRYLSKRKPAVILPEVPPIPPHVIALENLEKLREKKLWQGGKYKQYHSELTEIVRTYIEHRFNIPALEQVSEEILFSFRSVQISDELKSKLKQMLLLADMVKFAKLIPVQSENEIGMQYAFDLVYGTIPAEQPIVKKEETPNA